MSNTENIKLQFLGTCACDYSPKLENECKYCFDNDARRSSCVLIDECFLLDCGEHTLDSLDILKIPYDTISDIFITHTHDDHYNAKSIEKIAKSKNEPLKLWVREGAQVPKITNVVKIEMKPYQKYQLSNGAYLTSLLANHDAQSFPQHFIYEKNEKKMFYGCDGAWLLAEAYNYLRGQNLNLMVLDATVGDYEGDYRMAEHNSIPMIRLMLPSLRTNRTINDDTRIVLSHIAPSLHKSHAETVKIASGFGAEVAYDGLYLEI